MGLVNRDDSRRNTTERIRERYLDRRSRQSEDSSHQQRSSNSLSRITRLRAEAAPCLPTDRIPNSPSASHRTETQTEQALSSTPIEREANAIAAHVKRIESADRTRDVESNCSNDDSETDASVLSPPLSSVSPYFPSKTAVNVSDNSPVLSTDFISHIRDRRESGTALPAFVTKPFERATGVSTATVTYCDGPDAVALNRRLGSKAFYDSFRSTIYYGSNSGPLDRETTYHELAHHAQGLTGCIAPMFDKLKRGFARVRLRQWGFPADKINELPLVALQNTRTTMQLYRFGVTTDDFYRLPSQTWTHPETFFQFLNAGLSIEDVTNFFHDWWEKSDVLLALIEVGVSVDNLRMLAPDAWQHPVALFDFIRAGIDPHSYPLLTGKLLRDHETALSLYHNGFTIRQLSSLPEHLWNQSLSIHHLLEIGLEPSEFLEPPVVHSSNLLELVPAVLPRTFNRSEIMNLYVCGTGTTRVNTILDTIRSLRNVMNGMPPVGLQLIALVELRKSFDYLGQFISDVLLKLPQELSSLESCAIYLKRSVLEAATLLHQSYYRVISRQSSEASLARKEFFDALYLLSDTDLDFIQTAFSPLCQQVSGLAVKKREKNRHQDTLATALAATIHRNNVTPDIIVGLPTGGLHGAARVTAILRLYGHQPTLWATRANAVKNKQAFNPRDTPLRQSEFDLLAELYVKNSTQSDGLKPQQPLSLFFIDDVMGHGTTMIETIRQYRTVGASKGLTVSINSGLIDGSKGNLFNTIGAEQLPNPITYLARDDCRVAGPRANLLSRQPDHQTGGLPNVPQVRLFEGTDALDLSITICYTDSSPFESTTSTVRTLEISRTVEELLRNE